MGASRRSVDRAGDLLRGRTLLEEDLLSDDEHDAINLLERFRAEFEAPLHAVVGHLRDLLAAGGLTAQPTERLKRVPRIIEKLVRHPTMQLSRMQDIAGCRIVVPDLESVARIQNGLLANATVERVDDYNRLPKSTGYRALHVIVRAQASSVEIQVRTPWQQAWARSIELLDAHPNLVLLRTFSKVHGLCGLRVGFALCGSEELPRALDQVRQPFYCNALAQAAAVESLAHQDEVIERVTRTVAERISMDERLRALGISSAVSQANFCWLALGEERDEAAIMRGLKERGVLVRAGGALGSSTPALRVTYGLPEENRRFLDALAEVL